MENFKYIVLLALCLVGCRKEVEHSRLVVEGWIDEGKHPVVMVHRSYSLDADNTAPNATLADIIEEQMVLFGRVAIFDGVDTVVLTGKVDTNYMPPYIYTTVFMRGEADKTYHLLVTDHGSEALSVTTIPNTKPVIDSFTVQQPAGTFYPQLVANVSHLEVGEHYIVMAKTKPRGQYKICPLGVVEARNTQMAIDVKYYSAGGLELNLSQTDENPVYDTVYVKLAHIGPTEYLFWDSFVAQSITQGIFFMETHRNIETNIQNGNGYWCGMAANEYTVSLLNEIAADTIR